MTFDEFSSLVSSARVQYPKGLGLDADRLATDRELVEAQRQLGVAFPDAYGWFLKEFGGGFFALGTIFSVQAGSEWNVVDVNRKWADSLGKGFVAIADNHCGDFHGFRYESGQCAPQIWFYDHDGAEWLPTPYNDFLEFVHRHSLQR
jgi:hypothetical protein